MPFNLSALSEELESAVEQSSSVVVAVQGRGRTPASGVIWREGVIVTSEHPLKQEEDVVVVLPGGEQTNAKLAGRDPGTDLAVLRYQGSHAPALQENEAP